MAAMFALLAGVARADWVPQWGKLKVGMDRQTARACVGMPLLQNRGRGGCEVWTFDECGYIQLQFGRVTYWEAPKPIAAQLAVAKAIEKSKALAATPKATREGSAVTAQD